jgi:hypothetical protein
MVKDALTQGDTDRGAQMRGRRHGLLPAAHHGMRRRYERTEIGFASAPRARVSFELLKKAPAGENRRAQHPDF